MKRILLITIVSLIGCSASKKNVSINKSHVDSSIVTHTEAVHVVKVDSTGNNKKVDSGQRVTEITYVPFEVDSSDYVEAPANSVIVHKGKKKVIYVPSQKITEQGTSTQTNIATTKKIDSSNLKSDAQAHVVKDVKIVEKKKFKISSWLWLLIFLIPFASPKFRTWVKKLFIPLFFLLSFQSMAQNTFHGCPLAGDRNLPADSLKNRWVIPLKYNKMHLSYLLNLKNNSFNSTDPVEIEGYILEIKDGGLESTNCHSYVYKDTHIYVVDNPNEKDKKNALVVEVTPRIRELMRASGKDWTTKGLRSFIGKRVIIDGYLFCDSEHKQNSKADSPNGTNLWRASVYEIHPVTNIYEIQPN